MSTAPLPPNIPRPDLEAWWMPFTPNRQFKANPRLLARADGMYYWSADGRRILDGVAGLWCVNAGHNRREIAEAVHRQLVTLDYAPSFQIGHPAAFELANRLTRIAPSGFDHVFFTNSGSESVDTALKIALAYHRARGEGQRQRLIGREKALSRRRFRRHLGRRHGQQSQGFRNACWRASIICRTRSISGATPSPGACHRMACERADELERLVALHDASTIAAVIVEPVSGSAGVILPPRATCSDCARSATSTASCSSSMKSSLASGAWARRSAAQEFDVLPDLITAAKGTDERLRADGRGVRAQVRIRRLHAGPGKRHRAFPRLHLLGTSGRVCGRACNALYLSA